MMTRGSAVCTAEVLSERDGAARRPAVMPAKIAKGRLIRMCLVLDCPAGLR